MSTPNPVMLARIAQKRLAEAQAALIDPDGKAKVVRPGLVAEQVQVIHDGVVKTKHLKPGMSVRPWIHGAPRGAERVISKASRVEDGAMWLVECESDFDPQEKAAAYRWYCEALDGATVTKTIRKHALVPYQEV